MTLLQRNLFGESASIQVGITRNVELFAIIQNAFNNNYATFGIFGNVTRTPLPGVPMPSDPRFVTLAAPVSVFGGVRVKF